MNLSDLNWNIHTKALWGSKKFFFEEKIKKLQWTKVVNGEIELPPQVAFELDRYAKAAGIQKVLEVAYDNSMPGEMIYGIKAQFKNGVATAYLYSDTKIVRSLAVSFVKKITPINVN